LIGLGHFLPSNSLFGHVKTHYSIHSIALYLY
jgi:hypothetical protein